MFAAKVGLAQTARHTLLDQAHHFAGNGAAYKAKQRWHGPCISFGERHPARNRKPLSKETDMETLTINDLPKLADLDHKEMSSVTGGMGRTPQQILAWEISGKPATWEGLVLEDDGRLHLPHP